MVKKYDVLRIFAGMALFLLVFSCKSTPPGPSMAPDELNQARSDAEYQRMIAIDFLGPQYFPQEYNAAEAIYARAQALESSGAAGFAEAFEQYVAAAAAYRQLNDVLLPRYFDDKAQESAAAREDAVTVGAQTYNAEALAEADQAIAHGQERYEAKDYYPAKEQYALALNYYWYLKPMAEAQGEKADIDANRLDRFDPAGYAQAAELIDSAALAFGQEEYPQALSDAEEGLAKFREVSHAGWLALSQEKEQAVRAEQSRALEIKAEVAMRRDYEAALAVYQRGNQSASDEEYKTAYSIYSEAETLFNTVYRNTLQRRRSAETMIRNADRRISESGDLARTVQAELQGGSR